MKIVFKKNVLIEAVSYALCAVSNKNMGTSVQGILIETLADNICRLSSYDYDKGLNITIEANVIEEGNCIINAQRLNQIIRILPESEIEISLSGNIACVKSGKSEFEVASQRGDEFPSMPELDTESGFTIKQKVLFKSISQTLFAVPQNNQRQVFTGSLFKIDGRKMTVVGCDGYRLAVKESLCDMKNAPENINQRVIIPGKTLSELMKIIGDNDDDITIKASNKHIVFEVKKKNLLFFSRLLDGEYIDYERILPRHFETFVIADNDILLSALERAALVSEESTSTGTKSYVRLSIKQDDLVISSVSAKGKVKDELTIEKEGKDIEILFNCRYLIDSLKACDSTKVKISLESPKIGIIIEPEEAKENEKLTVFVLPVMIK
ncbi:MAG: DNA polymerase III subunit beta [Ruminococcaceae bacterium]|nr:DNA polymerase III subunit beta [Oscillospiraceae bacterium]